MINKFLLIIIDGRRPNPLGCDNNNLRGDRNKAGRHAIIMGNGKVTPDLFLRKVPRVLILNFNKDFIHTIKSWRRESSRLPFFRR